MANCKDCAAPLWSNTAMVMLKDELWLTVCDKTKDLICADCIEKRLGRSITVADLSLSEGDHIPCNLAYIYHKDRREYDLIVTEKTKDYVRELEELLNSYDDLM